MKKCLIVCSIMMALLCTGCMKIEEWSEESVKLMSEYIADSILRYDDTYENKLESMEESSEEQVTSPLPPSVEHIEETSEKQEEIKEPARPLQEVITHENIKIEYSSVKRMKQYPETQDSSVAVLSAKEGNSFVVVFFTLTNTTSEKQTVNMLDQRIAYALNCDGVIYPAVMTILEDDLQFLQTTLEPNASMTAMVAFDLKEANGSNEFTLQVMNNGLKTELLLNNK